MKKIILAVSSIALLTFAGCSSADRKTERAVDQKIATEPVPKDGAQLSTETDNLIRSAEGLTTDQKNKLYDLRDSTSTLMRDYSQQSLQLRSILIKDLLANKSNAREIDAVKKRLRKVEEEKLNTLMSAVDKARVILGKQFTGNRHVVNGMFTESRDRATQLIQ